MNRKLSLIFLTLMCMVQISEATHNRAGEITFRQIGPLTLEVTITTYTKASSVGADRDSVLLDWGDGNFENLVRSNGNGLLLENDVKKNTYEGVHNFPALGTYTLSMMDPNRIEGIENIANSVIVPFYIRTKFTFTNTQFQGFNNSPQLLQPPIDIGCVGQTFRHNPNAYDPDGDSLAYELIIPLQTENEEVPDYRFPDQINPVGNSIFLNPVTGDFVWITPRKAGDYNIAILIKEYRNGQLINSIIRDMQILITTCNNVPPRVYAPEEVCVWAGDTVRFDVSAEAPSFEMDQKVMISAIGGPLELNDPTILFDIQEGYQDDTLTGTFVWPTRCNQISEQPYTVVFKAVDDFFGNSGLADLKTVRIKVMGPPPLNLQGDFVDNRVRLEWEYPYSCQQTENEYFRGFSIWRRNDSNPFIPDSCTAGLEGQGYTRIAFNQRTNNGLVYQYDDLDNLERGQNYCYRILADFALITPGGLPYNPVPSIPSYEVCVQLGQDLPFITKVDVDSTDLLDGRIILNWTKPNEKDLDTIQNPGPYRYQILRADGINGQNFTPISNADFSYNTFGETHESTFIDSSINTVDQGYNYSINFYTGSSVSNPLGSSSEASSIFLDIFGTDQRNELSWSLNVPWTNFFYEIYRYDPLQDDFLLIGQSLTESYVDQALINGQEYCYYIRSVGSYSLQNLNDTLYNRSQIHCATPEDNIPPCSPSLQANNICTDANFLLGSFVNDLTWSNPADFCADSRDIVRFELYYAPGKNQDFDLLEILDPDELGFEHFKAEDNLSACYYITAFDSVGNQSAVADTLCTDNCPQYALPNTFTPNDDGRNDVFLPLENLFIESIDMKIYNRWGNLVFETSDPEINWNGTLNDSGEELPDGTYYYVCKVFENRLNGVIETEQALTGFIDLIR